MFWRRFVIAQATNSPSAESPPYNEASCAISFHYWYGRSREGLTTQNSANNNCRAYYRLAFGCILEVSRPVPCCSEALGKVQSAVCGSRRCVQTHVPQDQRTEPTSGTPGVGQKAKHRSPQLSRRKTMKTLRLLPLRLFLASKVLF